MIQFDCPHCGQHYEVKPEFAGKTARCRQCNNTITFPADAAPPAHGTPPLPKRKPAAAPSAREDTEEPESVSVPWYFYLARGLAYFLLASAAVAFFLGFIVVAWGLFDLVSNMNWERRNAARDLFFVSMSYLTTWFMSVASMLAVACYLLLFSDIAQSLRQSLARRRAV